MTIVSGSVVFTRVLLHAPKHLQYASGVTRWSQAQGNATSIHFLEYVYISDTRERPAITRDDPRAHLNSCDWI